MFKFNFNPELVKKIAINAAAGLGCFGAGALVGHVVTKKIAEKKAKAEQKAATPTVANKKAGKEEKSESKPDDSESHIRLPYGQRVIKLGYDFPAEEKLAEEPVTEEDVEEEADDDDYRKSSLPYRISSRGFGADPAYSTSVYTYWAKDHVFSDEWDEVVSDPDRLFGILDDDFYDIGDDEFNESYDIRNESLGSDFRIIRKNASYKDTVYDGGVY